MTPNEMKVEIEKVEEKSRTYPYLARHIRSSDLCIINKIASGLISYNLITNMSSSVHDETYYTPLPKGTVVKITQ